MPANTPDVELSQAAQRTSKARESRRAQTDGQNNLEYRELQILGTKIHADGGFDLDLTGARCFTPQPVSPFALAISMVAPVLGPALPAGSTLIFDVGGPILPGKVVAVVEPSLNRCYVLAASIWYLPVKGFSLATDQTFALLPDNDRQVLQMVGALC